MFFYDITYILLLPAIILAAYAQMKVSSTFGKYSKVNNQRGYTAVDVARQLLLNAGITDVRVEKVRGNLTDHYDPKSKVLRLSETVYDSTSVAALGVAAHETGHAIQHNVDYAPLKIRTSIYPIVNFSSRASGIIILLGFLFGFFGEASYYIMNLGIILFSATVFFQVITLPVEFNASSRALKLLNSGYYLTDEETGMAKEVLSAAALTYVAAALNAILQLFRLIIISNSRRD